MRQRRKILLILLAGFVLLILGVNVYIQQYKEEITNYVVAQINQQIDAEIELDENNASIDMYSHFPHINLTLPSFIITSNGSELMNVDLVSIDLSLIDLLQSKKTVRKIGIEEGVIYLEKDKQGKLNYKIGSSSNSSIDYLSIPSIQVINVQIVYKDFTYSNINEPKSVFKMLVDKALFDIVMDKSKINITSEGNAIIQTLESSGKQLLMNQKANINGQVEFDIAKSLFRFNNVYLEYGVYNTSLQILGSIDVSDPNYNLFDIVMELDDPNTSELVSILKSMQFNFPYDYIQDGSWDIVIKAKGAMASWRNPDLIITYANNGLFFSDGDLEIDNISSKGEIKIPNKGNLIFNADSLYFEIIDQTFRGVASYNYTDFNDFEVILNLDGTLNLSYLTHTSLLPEEIQDLSGSLKISSSHIKYIKRPKTASKLFFRSKYQMDQFSMTIEDYDIDIKKAVGYADSYHLEFDKNDMIINMQKINFDGSIYYRDDLFVNGTITSALINANKLISGDDDPFDLEAIPRFDVDLNINQLTYDHIDINHLTGRFKNKSGRISSDDFRFDGVSGSFNGYGSLHQYNKGNLYFDIVGSAQQLEVSEVFKQLEDFGQNTLTHQHLSGKLNADFKTKFQFDNNFNLIMKTIDFEGHTIIKNGELNNFKPLESLSSYISINELRRIQFEDLENNIKIKNGLVHIPNMRILSNAFNIEIEGTHDFDNQIDYKVRMRLSSLLSKKKNIKGLSETVDFDEKGKANLFLIMQGDLEDPDIKFDTKRVKQKLKQDIKNQGTRIKNAFKVEFGKEKKKGQIVDQDHETEEFIDWDDQ